MKLLIFSMLILQCYCTVEDGAHSASQHYDKETGEHNDHYDHKAVLGSSELEEEFDQLPPEESKRRLALLFKIMDVDQNGFVNKEELTEWILTSFKKLDGEDSLEDFKKQDKNEDGKVTWEEYIGETFGYNPEDMKDFHERTDEDHEDFKKMMDGDHQKFQSADVNKDGNLDEEDYKGFSHPHDYEHMHQVEIARILSEYDMDKDGEVNREEFLKDVTDKEAKIFETEQFASYDKNDDGILDKTEIVEWVLPSNREAAVEEATHLITMADTDSDEQLTEEEMVNKYDEFVGSQGTNYGHYLPKDEL